jgi:hypothetical protein
MTLCNLHAMSWYRLLQIVISLEHAVPLQSHHRADTNPPAICPYTPPPAPAYSPNNLLTLFNTLSFSGSYGWSLLGISSSEGNAAVYASTRCLIFSAMCWLIRRMAMSLRSCVKLSKAFSIAAFSVFASTTRKFFWASGGCVTCCVSCQIS